MDSFPSSQIIRKPATQTANGGIVAAQHRRGAGSARDDDLSRRRGRHTVYFGMRAPAGLEPDHYPLSGEGRRSFPLAACRRDRQQIGATSIAVPGTVAGMNRAYKFGDLNGAIWCSTTPTRITCRLVRRPDHASSTRELAKIRWPPPPAQAAWPTIAGWTALSDKRIDMSAMAETLGARRQGAARILRRRSRR